MYVVFMNVKLLNPNFISQPISPKFNLNPAIFLLN